MKILCGSALGQVRVVNPEQGQIVNTYFPSSGHHAVKHMTFINSCTEDFHTDEMQFVASRGDWEIVLARTATGQILGKLELGSPEEIEASKLEFQLTEEQIAENTRIEQGELKSQQSFKRKRQLYNKGDPKLQKNVVPGVTLFPQLSRDFHRYDKTSTSKTEKGFSLVGLACWQPGEDKTILLARKDGRVELHQFNESQLSDTQDDSERENIDAEEELTNSKTIEERSAKLFNIEAPLHKVRVQGNLLLAGGEDNPVKIYDIEKQKLVWAAQKLPADNYGVQEPIWVTDMTLMENGNTMATVDANHHAYVYDIRDKDCMPWKEAKHSDFAFTSIAPVRCRNDHEVVFGNAVGNMFSWDFRDPKREFLHVYRGTAGSVRAIAPHPTDSRVVCSLSADRRVRVYHAQRRNLLHSTFLVSMQHSMLVSSSNVEKAVDSDDEESSSDEEESDDEEQQGEDAQNEDTQNEDDALPEPKRRKKTSSEVKGLLRGMKSTSK